MFYPAGFICFRKELTMFMEEQGEGQVPYRFRGENGVLTPEPSIKGRSGLQTEFVDQLLELDGQLGQFF